MAFSRLSGFLRLIRAEHSIMIAFAVVAAEIIAGGGNIPSLTLILESVIGASAIGASAFVINDYFDVDADRINGKNRPLVEGIFSKKSAVMIYVILGIIGLVASLLISAICLEIALVFGAISLLYSYRLKTMPVIGNAYVALSMAIPFVFGNYAVSNSLNQGIYLVSAMVFLSGLSREVHGTIRDLKGDVKARNAKTLPIYIGVKGSAVFGLILTLFAVLISLFLFATFRPFLWNYYYLVPILVVDILLLYIGIEHVIIKKGRREFYALARHLSLYAMIIAILAIFIAALVHA